MGQLDNNSIDGLLLRVLRGTVSSSDIDLFAEWIKDPENERYFEDYKLIWHSVESEIINDIEKKESAEDILVSFINYIRTSKKRKLLHRRLSLAVSAAASIVLLIGIYGLFRYTNGSDNESEIFSLLSYNSDSIKVELADGSVVNSQNTSELNYQNSDNTKNLGVKNNLGTHKGISKQNKLDTLNYNSVTIPPGERFVVVLSDGTKVYLYSGSYLRYPVHFGSSSRNVTLDGRAYFDVSKSKVPFIVYTEGMEVEVLGTSFDVEAKKNSDKSSVILIEGSVKVHSLGESTVIRPDEMFSINKVDKASSLTKVDSRAMTQWKDGILVLREASFDELIKYLSDWYGVDIINRSSVSGSERFNGKFDRENIVDAVKTVALSAKVRYRAQNGKLIIVDYK